VPLGYVSLVLHAHLPFVRHPEREGPLEERWLFEAIMECYVPLLEMLERLEADGVPMRLTLSLSPTLMEMLDDPLLRSRYVLHLLRLIELSDREVALTAGSPEEPLARMYGRWLRRQYHLYWRRWGGDLLTAFRRLQELGCMEVITTCATHAFLPLLRTPEEVARAQVLVAVEAYRRRFGAAPRGFWLPECGYYPGVDRLLRQLGVEYCFVETHALTHARPAPPAGPYAPSLSPAGLALFARDPESSLQVWSAQEGYPGDPAYREFYRDIGWERDEAHLGEGLARTFTGLKYYRVTGRTEQKEPYDPAAARATAARHAAHFVWCRERQVEFLAAELARIAAGGAPPIVVAPYDAELFGHWWFEGPLFLEEAARRAAFLQGVFRFITPGDYLDRHGAGTPVEPELSSWGEHGYCQFWLDGANHWVYPQLHGAGRRMVSLAKRYGAGSDYLGWRALNQAGRELLLAQASDWPFILKAGTFADYARQRVTTHLHRFHRIAGALEEGGAPDPGWLAAVEAADNCFPTLDYRVFAPGEG
jgi:1,4-alpha-glucan branching enzyme